MDNESKQPASEDRLRLEAILAASPDAIIGTDAGGQVTAWNAAATRIFGISEAEAIGCGLAQLILPPDRAGALDAVFAGAAPDAEVEDACQQLALSAQHAKGHAVDIEAAVFARRNAGGDTFTCIARDVTVNRRMLNELQRATQDALAAQKARATFLATMSHEIRTPMNAVIGMSSILRDTGLTDEQAAHLDVIRTSADYLLSVIDEILDYSTVESGRVNLEVVPFSLSKLLGTAVSLVDAKAKQRGNKIQIQRDGVPDYWVGDAARLQQILLNLLSNAITFNRFGGTVTVTATVEAGHGEATALRFCVADEGPGIDVETQGHLFAPFERAQGTTQSAVPGTGLGLAIARQLARALGGELTVDSELGRGTSFGCHVPLKLAANMAGAESSSGLQSTSGRKAVFDPTLGKRHPLRIIVAEDNAVNRRVAQLMLDKLGYDANFVADGVELIDALNRQSYDLALVDIVMPNKNGVEAAREIVRDKPPAERPRLVAVTAHALAKDRDAAFEAGFEGYLVKPLNVDSLVEVLVSS